MLGRAALAFILAGLTGALEASPAEAQHGWTPATVVQSTSLPSTEFEANAIGPAGDVFSVIVTRHWSNADGLSGFRGVHYSAADGRTRPLPAFRSGGTNSPPSLAVDGSGTLHMVWATSVNNSFWATAYTRFEPSTGAWTTPQAMPGLPLENFEARLVALPSGHVMVQARTRSFNRGEALAVYDPATRTWSGPLDGPPRDGPIPIGAMTGSRVFFTWRDPARIHVQAFDAVSLAFGADEVVAAPGAMSSPPYPTVAVNTAGDMICAWIDESVFHWSRRDRTTGTWSAAAHLSFTDRSPGSFGLVLDAAGNATAVWETVATGGYSGWVQSARLSAGATAWSAHVDLRFVPVAGHAGLFNTSAVVDSLGIVTTAYSVFASGPAGVYTLTTFAARYSPARGSWSETVIATDGTLSRHTWRLSAAGDLALDWEAPYPASQNRTARWRSTLALPRVAGVIPGPGVLQVGVVMPSADEPEYAPTALEYSIDGGITWAPAAAASPLVINGLADGVVYDVRLRIVNALGRGSPTGPMLARSGTDTRPDDLRVIERTGDVLTLAWTTPPAGVVPEVYELEGGIGGVVLGAFRTGGAAARIVVRVPAGTFFIRVVSIARGVRSAPSPEIVVTGGPSLPAGPTHLLGSSPGDTLALSWTNQFSGAVPTGLRLDVTGAISTSVTLPVREVFRLAGVPAGTYTFTVRAMNGALAGAAGNAVTLTFPGHCVAAPNPPTAFSASTEGGRVFLDWLPPASGEAVTHYVVSATGAFSGSFPSAARTFSAPVPPGSYTISVAAVGPCGTSPATTAQTIVVP